MNLTIDLGDIISIGIAVLAGVFSLYIYIKHDKEIKAQENLINAYQLTRFKAEEDQSKKALIKGEYIPPSDGLMACFCIHNLGLAVAHNIRMEMEDDVKYTSAENLFPYELLNSQDHFDFYIMFFERYGTIKVKYIWDDEFELNREHTQIFNV